MARAGQPSGGKQAAVAVGGRKLALLPFSDRRGILSGRMDLREDKALLLVATVVLVMLLVTTGVTVFRVIKLEDQLASVANDAEAAAVAADAANSTLALPEDRSLSLMCTLQEKTDGFFSLFTPEADLDENSDYDWLDENDQLTCSGTG